MEKKMNNSSESLAHIEGTGVLLTECVEEVKKALGFLERAVDEYPRVFKDLKLAAPDIVEDSGDLVFNLHVAYNVLKKIIKKVKDYQEEMHIADMIDNFTENGF